MPMAVPFIAMYAAEALTEGLVAEGILTAGAAGLTAAEAAAIVAAAGIASSVAVSQYQAGAAARAQQRALQASRRDLQIILQTADAPHRVVFGRGKVSGPLAYAVSNGAQHAFLFRVVMLTGHEIDAYEEIYFNDDKLEMGAQLPASSYFAAGPVSGKYYLTESGPTALIEGFMGTATQAASTYLIGWDSAGLWNTNCRALGRAYMMVQTNWEAKGLYSQGPPNVAAVVRGMKCYDPRSATVAWTDNPAICIRQALKILFQVPDANLDDAAFTVAANLCDEWMFLDYNATSDPAGWHAYLDSAATHGLWQFLSGSNYRQRRYRCNGVFTLADDPAAILQGMVESCAGYLSYTGGIWRLVAGGFTTPTLTLGVSDLRGDVEFRAKPPMTELYNSVRGQFLGPMTNHVAVDYPAMLAATFIEEDGGLEYSMPLDLPFVNEAAMCNRIAAIMLYRSRQGVLKFPASLAALALRPGDTVAIQLPNLGFNGESFRVEDWSISEDLGVDLILRECAAGEYTWEPSHPIFTDPSPNLNLPDPWNILPVTGLTAASGAGYSLTQPNGVTVQRTRVSWDIIESRFQRYVEVESRVYGDEGIFSRHPRATDADGATYLLDLKSGVLHEIRARRVNSIGATSPWTEILHIVMGADVRTNLLLNSDFTQDVGNSGIFWPDARALRWWTSAATVGTYGFLRNYQGGTAWNIGNGGCCIYDSANTAGGYGYIWEKVPVAVGVEYEASVYVSIHRADVILYIRYVDAAGATLADFTDTKDSGATVIGLQNDRSQDWRLWCKGTAPANATHAQIIILCAQTANSAPYPFTAWSRGMFTVAPPGVTRETATPWADDALTNPRGVGMPMYVQATSTGSKTGTAVGGGNTTLTFDGTAAAITLDVMAGDTLMVEAEYVGSANVAGGFLQPTLVATDVIVTGSGVVVFRTGGSNKSGNARYVDAVWTPSGATDKWLGTSVSFFPMTATQQMTVYANGGVHAGDPTTSYSSTVSLRVTRLRI